MKKEESMLNISICDDEIYEIKKIHKMVDNFMISNMIKYHITIFTSGEDLMKSKEMFDLVFLDISMGEMDGLQAGMKLYQKNLKIRIIYVTNFNQFLNEAINFAHAFAYLSKPIEEEQVSKQLSELVKIIGIDKKSEAEIEFRKVIEIGGEGKEHIFIKVPVSSIVYYEYVKSNRKVKVYMENKIYEFVGTMTEIEQKMKIYEFGVCCRGFLVNLSHVKKAKGKKVYLNTGSELPLSQKRAITFKNQLSDFVHRSIQ